MGLPARIEEGPRPLVHPATGEIIERTPEGAAFLLAALREHKNRVMDAIHECEALVLEESERQGAKTLQLGSFRARVTAGPETVWDVELLREGLAAAGCPEERISALIQETVAYKVNASVAKQLAAANDRYAAAVEAARSTVVKSYRVSVGA